MKKLFAVSLAVLVLSLTACDSGHKTAPVSITSPTSASATAGAAYSTTLTETGGTAPYTWTVASGSSLPAGLTLNGATGSISGTPTTAGTYTVMFTVTDSSKPVKTATIAFTLKVAPPPVSVPTTTLASGMVGTAFSQTLAASGGTPPYAWSVVSGSLPSGLTLDGSTGILSGTPTAAGTTQFTVQVTDAAGVTATEQLTFTASAAPLTGDALLQGQYFFKVDKFVDCTAVAFHQEHVGSLTFDGQGNVAGQSDYADDSGTTVSGTVAGSYAVYGDGRGILTLNYQNGDLQQLIVATGGAQAGSPATKFRLLEVDGIGGGECSGGYATGFLQVQDTTAFTTASLMGNRVFGLSGDSQFYGNTFPQNGGVSAAGLLAVGSDLTLGSASLMDIATNQVFDGNLALSGAIAGDSTAVGSSTALATYGRASLTLTSTTYPDGVLPAASTVYIIDAHTAYLLSAPAALNEPLLSGSLVQQQSGTFSNASLQGASILYGASQADGSEASYSAGNYSSSSGTEILYGSAIGMVALYSADGGGNFSTQTDENAGGTVTSAVTGTSTYSVAANGRVSVLGGVNPPVLWLSANNAGFGVTQPTVSGPWAMLLRLEPQTPMTYSNAVLSGDYVMGTEQPQSYLATMLSGEVHADGAGTLTGTVDFFSEYAAQYFGGNALGSAGTTSVAASGRVTVNSNYISGGSVAGTGSLVLYMISPTRAVGIDATS